MLPPCADMGVLFDVAQEYEGKPEENAPLTFKHCAAADIDKVFFNETEHADWHLIDGKRVLVILVESALKDHAAHWEAGAKQNFDTGLYTARATLYIRVADYGPKPKQGKMMVVDGKRKYQIQKCEDEGGVYRMTLERTRQS